MGLPVSPSPRLPVLLLMLFASVVPMGAQQYTHLAGWILDTSNAGIPNAVVSVVNEDTGFRRVSYSQPDGGYVVASLQPGVYKITVRKPGFRSMIRFGVKLEVSQPARVDFTLAVGSMQEAITVEGAPPLLNSADASVGALVLRDEIEHLPLNGRGLLGLLELAPGTVVTPATRGEPGQFTVNGQRPNAHYFTVDGVSANNGVIGGGLPAQPTGGALPGMTAFGSFHSLISLDALQEFRVQTSTVVPEFGRLPGAQISLSSRSGSNDFHGSLAYLFRHETLDANDWFANRHGQGRTPLRMSDFGATLGGPLRRNRTFFFLAYEGMRLRQPAAWRAAVPSLAVRQTAPAWVQPVFNLFPAPDGPTLGPNIQEWTGRNHRPSRLDVGSLRIDHAITSHMTAFARWNEAPSASQFGDTQVSQLRLRSRSITFGLNLRARSDIVLDSRLNFSSASSRSQWKQMDAGALPPCYLEPVTLHLLRAPGLCDYLVRLSVAGIGDVVSGREGGRSQSQLQFLETANVNRGSHALRIGLDYRRLAPRRRDATGTLSVIAESLDDLLADRNLWIGSSGPQSRSSVLREISLFAQDTWRITPRLTATYGVRWEFSTTALPDEAPFFLDPLRGIVVDIQQPIWQDTHTNFAPRFGIALRPAAEGSTVIRAGAGLYYDSSVSIATDMINGGPFSLVSYRSDRHAPFSSLLSFGFMPGLRLPLVTNWSASVEHALGKREVVSATYVGASGRDLLRREMGGPGSTQLAWLALATNNGASYYHGLQLEYRRSLARSLQGRMSYTWSHSIDNSSTDSLLQWAGAGSPAARDRGSSDFDVRHTVTGAFTWRVGRNWAVDGIFRARTGFPITVLEAEHFMGISFANAFRPNQVQGQPVWVADRAAPGGRVINRAAFQPAPESVQGVLGRNAMAGFGMSQLDLAVQREFSWRDQRSIQLRIEAFNALNHASFADPVSFLVSPLFGQPASMLNLMLGTGSPGSGLAPMFQTGGPRSVQATLRFRF